jgi:hypothetical protein
MRAHKMSKENSKNQQDSKESFSNNNSGESQNESTGSQTPIEQEDLNVQLLKAVKKGEFKKVKSLLEAKGDPFIEDSKKNTLLHLIFLRALLELLEDCLQIADSLLRNGVEVNAQNEDGDTPLMLAVRAKSTPAVSMLLGEGGANVKISNTRGFTALHDSCEAGDEKITRLLLTYKADPNAETKAGKTPKMVVKASGKPNADKMLNLLNNPSQRNLRGEKKIKPIKQRHSLPEPRKSWQQELKEKVDATVAKIEQDELKNLYEPTNYLEYTPQQQLDNALKSKSRSTVITLFEKHNELLTTVNVAHTFKLGILKKVCEDVFKKKLLQSKSGTFANQILIAYFKGIKKALAEHKSKRISKEESKRLRVAEKYLENQLQALSGHATNPLILMPSVPQTGTTRTSADKSSANNSPQPGRG